MMVYCTDWFGSKISEVLLFSMKNGGLLGVGLLILFRRVSLFS